MVRLVFIPQEDKLMFKTLGKEYIEYKTLFGDGSNADLEF